MKPRSSLKVGILGSTNFITVLVNTILFPVFPVMAGALGLELRDLAYLVGIVSFPAAIISLFGGILSDRLGRKLIMVISLFLFGSGGLISGFSILLLPNPYPIILVGRFIQGLGAATPMFLTVALVGDIFKSIERNKAIGFLEMANGMGKVLSPILGAVIGLISWKVLFFIYPILAFPIAILTWIFIEEPPKKGDVDWGSQMEAFNIFKNPSRILTLLAGFISIFFLAGIAFWLSDFLKAKLDLGQVARGLVIALPSAALVLTTPCAGFISKKIHPRMILSGGILIMSIAIFIIPFSINTIMFWFVIIVIGIGAGTALPVIDTLSTSVKTDSLRGEVATIYGSIRWLASAFSPIIFSVLLEIGFYITFFITATFGLIIGVLVFLFLKEEDVLPKKLLPKKT